jgi:hypothetical protein
MKRRNFLKFFVATVASTALPTETIGKIAEVAGGGDKTAEVLAIVNEALKDYPSVSSIFSIDLKRFAGWIKNPNSYIEVDSCTDLSWCIRGAEGTNNMMRWIKKLEQETSFANRLVEKLKAKGIETTDIIKAFPELKSENVERFLNLEREDLKFVEEAINFGKKAIENIWEQIVEKFPEEIEEFVKEERFSEQEKNKIKEAKDKQAQKQEEQEQKPEKNEKKETPLEVLASLGEIGFDIGFNENGEIEMPLPSKMVENPKFKPQNLERKN